MSSGSLGPLPQIQIWPPHTAAARNAPVWKGREGAFSL